MACRGAHEVTVDTPFADLGVPAPFDRIVKAKHQGF